MRTGCKPRPDVGVTSSPRCLGARAGQHPAPAPYAVLGPCTLLPSHESSWCQLPRGMVGTAPRFARSCPAQLSETPICFGFRRCPVTPPFLPRACGYPGPRITLEHPLGKPTGSRVFPGQAQLVPQPQAGPYSFKSLSGRRWVTQGSAFSPSRQPRASPSRRVGRSW